MQRRSRLQQREPKPITPTKNEGQELAEALFPNANPAATETGEREAVKESAKDNTLGAVDVRLDATGAPLDEAPGHAATARRRKKDSGADMVEEIGLVKHEWDMAEDSGVREVKGSWRVTASTRGRVPEPLGFSSVLTEEKESGEGEGDAKEIVPNESDETPASESSESNRNDVWRKAASKRSRQDAVRDSQKPSLTEGSDHVQSTAVELGGDEHHDLEDETVQARTNSTEGDIKHTVRLSRRSGSLPWKSEKKRMEAEQVSKQEVVVLPSISIFTSDSAWERVDWILPRATQYHGDPMSSPAVRKVATSDCVNILDGLNQQQSEAVLADPTRACLVLAGPGSGKTRVLTHRIAYLIRKYNVSPHQILAVTFTNKAAEEMKERVSRLLSIKFAPVWAQGGGPRLAMGTFHSISARILREHGGEIGISSDFVICDTSDSRQIVSRLLKRASGSAPDSASLGEAVSAISKLKNDRDNELQKCWSKPVFKRTAELRSLYDNQLRAMNQLDFDDLLLETRKLLQTSPQVCEVLQDTYQHVLVDEWQDTNHVQFDLVSTLAGRKHNLFVVGDADQSIYKFRGADSGNLDRFMRKFPNAERIALERNYRSSGCIVAAAQAIIEGNKKRPTKKMTTANDFGDKITVRETLDDRQESQFVVSTMNRLLQANSIHAYSDVAILYRTNAQSRSIEEACIQNDIPYRLLSGTKFYDRQEIRDLVAYLRVISNPCDDSAFRRILNMPPRGIGKKTQDELETFCESRALPLTQGLNELLQSYADGTVRPGVIGLGKAAIMKLADFHATMQRLREKSRPFMLDDDTTSGEESVDTLLTAIIDDIGYKEYLQKRENRSSETSEKTIERLGNVEELVRAASRHSNLHKYLESVTLMVDTMHKREKGGADSANQPAVSLMTLHGGKGLEFGAVFIIGVEDSVIPISRGDDGDVEEERRLFYVGMTRAKQHLYITWRRKKLVLQGGKSFSRESAGPSRFLEDLPDELVTRIETSSSQWTRSNDASKKTRSRSRRRASGGRRTSEVAQRSALVEGGNHTVVQWRAGDSVRCSNHGRGTVTIGAPESSHGAWIEVMFADGSKHFVNTVAQDVELLFSPSP